MVPFNNFLGLAGVGALIACTTFGTPARAEDANQSEDQPRLSVGFHGLSA